MSCAFLFISSGEVGSPAEADPAPTPLTAILLPAAVSSEGDERSLARDAPAAVVAAVDWAAPVAEEVAEVEVPVVPALGGGSCLDLGEDVVLLSTRTVRDRVGPFAIDDEKSPETRLPASG